MHFVHFSNWVILDVHIIWSCHKSWWSSFLITKTCYQSILNIFFYAYQVLICSWTRNRKKWRPSLKLATKEILFSFITWNFRRFLVRSEFVCGFALVLPKSGAFDARQNQSVAVATMVQNSLIVRHGRPIFEPSHFGSGWSMNNTNDLGLVVFVGVDKCLFLFNLGSICKIKRVINQQCLAKHWKIVKRHKPLCFKNVSKGLTDFWGLKK